MTSEGIQSALDVQDNANLSKPSKSHQDQQWKPNGRVYMIVATLCVSSFLPALEATVVALALPAMTKDLNLGKEFAWVGSIFLLFMTISQPVYGLFADCFGRKVVLVMSHVFFLIGSLITAVCKTFPAMLAGRGIQGLGSGGLIVITEIIVSDIVPLTHRGAYNGMINMAYAFGTCIGPVISGAFSEKVTWRWNFYLMLPVGAIAALMSVFLVQVKRPNYDFKHIVKTFDWLGIALTAGSVTCVIMGLTWGGVIYDWDSSHVLATLVVGGAGMLCLIPAEVLSKHPCFPKVLFANRTTNAGYFISFIHGVFSMLLFYYNPIFFQSVAAHGPLRSAIDTFPSTFVLAPAAAVSGILMSVLQDYKYIQLFGGIIQTVGVGLQCLWNERSPMRDWMGFQVPTAIGLGVFFSVPVTTIQANVREANLALATATAIFLRNFGQIFGVAIGGAILQNQFPLHWRKELTLGAVPPASVRLVDDVLTNGSVLALTGVAQTAPLAQNAELPIRVAFAGAFRVLYYTGIPLSALCLFSSLCMKRTPLRNSLHTAYGIEEQSGRGEQAE